MIKKAKKKIIIHGQFQLSEVHLPITLKHSLDLTTVRSREKAARRESQTSKPP